MVRRTAFRLRSQTLATKRPGHARSIGIRKMLMMTLRVRLGLALASGMTLLYWTLGGIESSAAFNQQAKAGATRDPKFLGAATCQRCHAAPGNYSPEFVQLTEYSTWRTE